MSDKYLSTLLAYEGPLSGETNPGDLQVLSQTLLSYAGSVQIETVELPWYSKAGLCLARATTVQLAQLITCFMEADSIYV
jgi:hypothetical protein